MAYMISRLNKQLKFLSLFIAFLAALWLLSYQITTSAITRGYSTTDTGLQVGMVVVLSADSSDNSQVVRATQADSQRIVGVVTTLESSLVTVASSNTKVLVESEGEIEAYVTDIQGDVKKGDPLTLSPLKGILMKQSGSTGTVVGIAAADLSSADAETYPVKEDSTTKNVKIAKLKINLNRQVSSDPEKTNTSLSRLGRALTGKDISELRVLIAAFIFLLVLVAEGGILYAGISAAVSAIGRNPLARKIIRRELLRVVLVSMVVLVIGLAAIYIILWA